MSRDIPVKEHHHKILPLEKPDFLPRWMWTNLHFKKHSNVEISSQRHLIEEDYNNEEYDEISGFLVLNEQLTHEFDDRWDDDQNWDDIQIFSTIEGSNIVQKCLYILRHRLCICQFFHNLHHKCNFHWQPEHKRHRQPMHSLDAESLNSLPSQIWTDSQKQYHIIHKQKTIKKSINSEFDSKYEHKDKVSNKVNDNIIGHGKKGKYSMFDKNDGSEWILNGEDFGKNMINLHSEWIVDHFWHQLHEFSAVKDTNKQPISMSMKFQGKCHFKSQLGGKPHMICLCKIQDKIWNNIHQKLMIHSTYHHCQPKNELRIHPYLMSTDFPSKISKGEYSWLPATDYQWLMQIHHKTGNINKMQEIIRNYLSDNEKRKAKVFPGSKKQIAVGSSHQSIANEIGDGFYISNVDSDYDLPNNHHKRHRNERISDDDDNQRNYREREDVGRHTFTMTDFRGENGARMRRRCINFFGRSLCLCEDMDEKVDDNGQKKLFDCEKLSESDDDDSVHWKLPVMIAGISLGALCLIIIPIVIYCMCCRDSEDVHDEEEDSEESD